MVNSRHGGEESDRLDPSSYVVFFYLASNFPGPQMDRQDNQQR